MTKKSWFSVRNKAIRALAGDNVPYHIVAKAFGISRQRVHQIAGKRGRHWHIAFDCAALEADLAQGMGVREASGKHGVSYESTRRFLLETVGAERYSQLKRNKRLDALRQRFTAFVGHVRTQGRTWFKTADVVAYDPGLYSNLRREQVFDQFLADVDLEFRPRGRRA